MNASSKSCFKLGQVVNRHAQIPGDRLPRQLFFCIVPNFSGFSVWNVLHITVQLPRIFKFLLDFWKISAPLVSIDECFLARYAIKQV
jgi:hypothetical protein